MADKLSLLLSPPFASAEESAATVRARRCRVDGCRIFKPRDEMTTQLVTATHDQKHGHRRSRSVISANDAPDPTRRFDSDDIVLCPLHMTPPTTPHLYALYVVCCMMYVAVVLVPDLYMCSPSNRTQSHRCRVFVLVNPTPAIRQRPLAIGDRVATQRSQDR